MSINTKDWEIIIGLEIHVELNTQSKLFSPAANRFGDEPNNNIGVVCTGQPGALPVLNKEAVKKAVQIGLALQANINLLSKFDRKSYFYPDSPRNFQITQLDKPIVMGGEVKCEVEGEEKIFQINRAHLEDDAGMLKHFSKFAGVDYNRAGVPLLEIVSEPCLHSAKDASAYAQAIRSIVQYVGASDCNMEEGSLRFDANISVRKRGEEGFRNKIEVKNMNSFSNLELAIEQETIRQINLYNRYSDKDPSEVIEQATYRWDPEQQTTVLMRKKEDAEDYRYFPEPDLPPLLITQKFVDGIKEKLPELPLERKKRYIKELELTPYNASILTQDKELSDYFEEGLQITKNARNLCNWITVEFAGRIKDSGDTLQSLGIPSKHIAELVNLIDSNKINGKIAKKVADDMLNQVGTSPEAIVAANPDYQPIDNTEEVESFVDTVIKQEAQSVSDFKAGKAKAFGYLVGQVMKLSRGKAPPDLVNKLLKEKL
ncbi:MAG: Asp-tRNA(Asn)/Glu-tRNA(Gln) amidotransferase subunit GatB [Chlamydiales bacterium]|nr:Asp-tRNA(Asn)/Glu-tRNA(Gln) amidotransferase subunit GatB [Chlamydiales bacterium]